MRGHVMSARSRNHEFIDHWHVSRYIICCVEVYLGVADDFQGLRRSATLRR